MNIGSIKQQTLFYHIDQKIGNQHKLPTQVAEVLGMSESNIYKKLNGSSLLQLEQIILLCKHYQISFDDLFLQSDDDKAYPFYSDALTFRPKTVEEYWINIYNHLHQLVELEGLTATYLANEIPFFYYLQFPHLFSFKTDVWNKVSWKINPEQELYNPDFYLHNLQLIDEVSKISHIYNSFSSVEIWNPEMLRLTFMQLKYFIMAKTFRNREDIDLVVFDIEKMILHMKNIAKNGKKQIFGQQKSDVDVSIYLNHLSINSEMILINSNDFNLLYNKYDSPNYIRSNDTRVCEHMSEWLSSIVNQSTVISTQGQRDRDAFFQDLLDSFDRFKERMDNLIKAHY